MFLTRVFKKVVGYIVAAALITSAHADPIITGSIPFTFIPGTVISSSQVNANFQDIITKVNTNAAKNGVNSSITALLGLTTPIDPNVGGSPIWNATTIGGTGDAITVSATRPAISSFSYTVGNILSIVPTAANTGATTINVNGLGVVDVLKVSDTGAVALADGDLAVGIPYFLYYNGADFISIAALPYFGTRENIASAATTDLGTVASHNVHITGSVTITSFGSSADVASPLYYVKCAADINLTKSANLQVLGTNSGFQVCKAGDTFWARYAGGGVWIIEAYWPSVNLPSLEAINGLTIVNNAGTPTTHVDVTIAGGVICTTTAYCIRTPAATYTINATTNGVNGLDTGALANNTWYHMYIISDGGNHRALMSTSATSPTMPAGYTYKYRVGAIRTLGAATFIRIRQRGNRTQYVVVAGSTTPNLPIMASGNSGSTTVPTWTAIATGAYVPPTANSIQGAYGSSLSGGAYEMILAPNNAYGTALSTTNPPPHKTDYGGNGNYNSWSFDFVLETSDIYYAATGLSQGPYVAATGWIDAVNAN